MLSTLVQKCYFVDNRIHVVVLDLTSLEGTTNRRYIDEKD